MSCNNCGNLINGGRSDHEHLCNYPKNGGCKESSYMTPSSIHKCQIDYRHMCYAGRPDFRAYDNCNDCPQHAECTQEHNHIPPLPSKETDPDLEAFNKSLEEGIPFTNIILRKNGSCFEFVVPINDYHGYKILLYPTTIIQKY